MKLTESLNQYRTQRKRAASRILTIKEYRKLRYDVVITEVLDEILKTSAMNIDDSSAMQESTYENIKIKLC